MGTWILWHLLRLQLLRSASRKNGSRSIVVVSGHTFPFTVPFPFLFFETVVIGSKQADIVLSEGAGRVPAGPILSARLVELIHRYQLSLRSYQGYPSWVVFGRGIHVRKHFSSSEYKRLFHFIKLTMWAFQEV